MTFSRLITCGIIILSCCVIAPATGPYVTSPGYISQGSYVPKVVGTPYPVLVPATVYVAQPAVQLQLVQGGGTQQQPQAPVDGPPMVLGSGSGSPPRGDHIQILRNDCASCHGNGRSSGGVTLFDASGNFVGDLEDAHSVIRKGRMPPSGPLDAAKKKVIRQAVLASLSAD